MKYIDGTYAAKTKYKNIIHTLFTQKILLDLSDNCFTVILYRANTSFPYYME